MTNRTKNMMIAKETLQIIERGSYNSKAGLFSIKNDLNNSIKNSKLYTPKMTNEIEVASENSYETIFEVENETTLNAARRLVEEGLKVVALNFASARKPGGGFLTGAMAQEESLAYSSGLYPTISQMKEMYNYHELNRGALYSDYMIYSPNVPVFRDDKYILAKPFLCSFITSPAVNAGIVKIKEKHNEKKIYPTMKTRIEKILKLALLHSNDAIVLGAFGCGVFQNDPNDVVEIFATLLLNDTRFKGRFKKVSFAVLDRDPNDALINIFKAQFNE